jgi:predicted dehydrogenase
VRVGVVGCGYWGSKHVRVLSGIPEVEQVAVIDPRPAVRAELVRVFPAARPFATLAEAVGHIDAVVVATPPETHAAVATQAIRAGLHVLVEKPMATSSHDARRVMREAAAAGVVLMVGHTFEYNAGVIALGAAIASGELGRVYYLDAARLNLGIYQSHVNVIWDLAPHDVSILNFLLGALPDRVQAWGSCHAHADLEDVAYLRLHYDQLDVTAQIHVSWLDPCKVRRVTAVGSTKMAVYNDLATEERLRIYDKGVDIELYDHRGARHSGQPPTSYRYGGIVSPHVPFPEPLVEEDAHFVACCRTGAAPRTPGASGLAVVSVLEAADVALRTGKAVELRDHMMAAAS